MVKNKNVQDFVRNHYGKIAAQYHLEKGGCGCGTILSPCCGMDDEIQLQTGKNLYQVQDVAVLPQDVREFSLGCGDPITLAGLQKGQTVLDLGSGGGFDCFLAAKMVGSSGKVIGVDLTPAMLDLARDHQAKLGIENVEFRQGEIEHLPVEDGVIDVVISNCVINLSPDKAQVFKESFRVLKPGGKLAVSDIVTQGNLPNHIREDLSAWAGCLAGAIDVDAYVGFIKKAGFTEIEVRRFRAMKGGFKPAEVIEMDLSAQVDVSKLHALQGLNANEDLELDQAQEMPSTDLSKIVFSAQVTARKPIDEDNLGG